MRWTLNEFVFEMQRDTRRKVFFVEGVRDQVFWSKTIDIPQSKDTVIYPISFLLVHVETDGERGRLLRCAETLSNSPVSDRLRFFADADFDRLLGLGSPANVWLTDGRDFESYFFLGRCLNHICDTLAPSSGLADESVYNKLQLSISRIARPIGILRLAARRNGWKLAFRRTLQGRGFGRFVVQNGDQEELDLDRLIRTLIQNSVDVGVNAVEIKTAFDIEDRRQAEQRLEQIVHGKDLTRLIGWYFGITDSFAANFLLLSLSAEIARIRTEPNIQKAAEWIAAAA